MESIQKKHNRSSAQEYVDNLITDGAKAACDDSSENFRDQDMLPCFYDEVLFKRGQAFFHKYLFSLFFSKCLGLIALLAVPSIRKVLMFTRMSGSDEAAFKRYMATILHMIVWYKSDFKPGSKLWKSIADVRGKHNFTSNRTCSAGMQRISQMDMALTQFGFMGISICRSEMLGIYEVSNEDWKAFVHLWRVIGYLMGIEDKFNLCSDSVEETRARCNIIMEEIIRPHVEEKDEDFLKMSRYMVNGLWTINLFIKFETMLYYLHILCQDNNNNHKKMHSTHFTLNSSQRSNLKLLLRFVYALRWNWLRIFENYSISFAIWMSGIFPFLAMYQFGTTKLRVKILDN